MSLGREFKIRPMMEQLCPSPLVMPMKKMAKIKENDYNIMSYVYIY
jgi:hypothetical protein